MTQSTIFLHSNGPAMPNRSKAPVVTIGLHPKLRKWLKFPARPAVGSLRAYGIGAYSGSSGCGKDRKGARLAMGLVGISGREHVTGWAASERVRARESGLPQLKAVNWNLSAPQLYEGGCARRGHVAKNGPLVVLTDSTPAVRRPTNSSSATPRANTRSGGTTTRRYRRPQFDTLYQSMMSYAQGHELFVQDLFGGADPIHRVGVRVVTEYAWHSLFIQHLLIEPNAGQRAISRPNSPSSICPASWPIRKSMAAKRAR